MAQFRTFRNLITPLSECELRDKRELWIDVVYHALAEVNLLSEFVLVADELGLGAFQLPRWISPKYSLNDYVDRIYPSTEIDLSWLVDEEKRKARESSWPAQLELWGNATVALAQHHGIPTRLLDWTRNPLAAAFFAAASVQDPAADDFIVVFSFYVQSAASHIHIVEAPLSENDYMRAQLGIFTLDLMGEELFLRNGRYPSLDESIDAAFGFVAESLRPRKYLLSVSQAPELLRLLWLERTTQAHLMPSLDNAANAVLTKIRLLGTTQQRRFAQ